MISQAHSVGICKWSRHDLTNVYTVHMEVWSEGASGVNLSYKIIKLAVINLCSYTYIRDDLSDGWKLSLMTDGIYLYGRSYCASPKCHAMHCPFGMSTLKYTLWCTVRTHTHAIFGDTNISCSANYSSSTQTHFHLSHAFRACPAHSNLLCIA